MSDPSEQSPATPTPHTWQRATTSGMAHVDATADDILRIAFATADAPPHRTWSLVGAAADLQATTVAIDDQGETVTLRTPSLQLTLTLDPPDAPGTARIHLARSDGSVALANATLALAEDGRPAWKSALASGERVYGGGERTGPLDKRGRRMTFWTTDPLPNHGELTDVMYQSIPFFIGLVDGRAHGVYFDVNERAVADIGTAAPDTFSYTPESADLVVYLFAGPALGDVLRQYTALTGRMAPQPRWAFGNQQSRWSYMSADEVLAIADQFRALAIPCDAIYLDIDYMRDYRVFTWDPDRFPDPAGLTRALGEQHMRLVTIIDPGVKVDPDYGVYQDGLALDFFARAADGAPFQGWVWPGLSCWTDFAQENAQTWWGALHRTLTEVGVAGIWNDMNEPSQAGIFAPPGVSVTHGATLPDDALHGAPDDTITHAQFHNAYGLAMGRATYEGLLRLRPSERPFVLTRAATAGSQRYAIVWNGDSSSNWDNLRLSIPLNLGMSLCGFPVTGGDVGGFWQDTTAELLVRWTQLGALLPFCRNHSAMGSACQEPWAFGEPYTSLCRSALELRYRLLPYLLTLAHEAASTGAPIVRPLAWIAPTHDASLACDDQFLLGDALLVAPVLEQGATTREALLPPGEWFTWERGEAHTGGQRLTIPVTLETMPLFVRAGTILPFAAVAQSTDGMTDQPLTLHVYLTPANPAATADIWLDDDHPQAEQREAYGLWQAQAEWQNDAMTVSLSRANGQLLWPYPGCSVTPHLPEGWVAEPLDTMENIQGDRFTVRFRVAQG